MDIRKLYQYNLNNSEKFAELMSVCYTLLLHSDLAKEERKYLINRLPSFNVEGFQFGYFPKNQELKELFKYINPEDLEKLGVIYKKCIYDSGHAEVVYYGSLRNHNLIMPYKDVYGNIIGLVGRTLLSEEEMKNKNIPKYKNTSIIKAINLFGLYEAKKEIIEKGFVIVVEGQFDCITCHRYGFKNVVALGGSNFTKYHLFLLKRYTNRIYLLLDGDNPGEKSTKKILANINKILEKYPDVGKTTQILSMKPPKGYKDVDECLRKNKDYNLYQEIYGGEKIS